MAAMTVGGVDRARRSFPAEPTSARAARHFVAGQLRAAGAADGTVADFQLAVSELAANAIEHGNGAPITVEVDTGNERWFEVSIVGHLPAEMPRSLLGSWTVAPPIASSGRGLGIVRRVMDDVGIETRGVRLVVSCRQRRRS